MAGLAFGTSDSVDGLALAMLAPPAKVMALAATTDARRPAEARRLQVGGLLTFSSSREQGPQKQGTVERILRGISLSVTTDKYLCDHPVTRNGRLAVRLRQYDHD
ncbi:hypothetical protein GCM10027290_20020 [Micromonospora sonneratiae]